MEQTYSQAYEKLVQMEEELSIEKRKIARDEAVIEKKKVELEALCDAMYREKQDVDDLTKNSFGTILKKIVGSYHEAYEKEYKEYLDAKMNYDEMAAEVEAYQKNKSRLGSSIRAKQRDIAAFWEEMEKQYPEAGELKKEREEANAAVYREMKELNEAIEAVRNTMGLAERAKSAYKGAKGWSTYDTFFGGGLIGDIAKYQEIDSAERLSAELAGAAARMKKELLDVRMVCNVEMGTIDPTTQMIDIVFDNMFTDFKVRGKIEDNIRKLEQYQSGLSRLMESLREREEEAKKKVRD